MLYTDPQFALVGPVCPIRPSFLYVEHPKNGTFGVPQHNRHKADSLP
jgi:hypothetical protein